MKILIDTLTVNGKWSQKRLMTPAQFWNYLISSGFTANSIGDRLQNAATVATTGGQIASYNI